MRARVLTLSQTGVIWIPADKKRLSTISLPALPGSRKRRGQEAASARVTVRLAASGWPGAATMQSVSAEKTSEMISG